jgi:hypothetical protein
MSESKVRSETVRVSRLGCMRKSTVVQTDADATVEHVKVRVPENEDQSGNDVGADYLDEVE